MIEPPELTTCWQEAAAVIHIRCPRDRIQAEVPPAITEILAAISEQGLAPQGVLFMHHLTMSSTHFDVEVGYPVGTALRAQGRVYPGVLPAARVARTIYHGPYEGLFGAWDAFGKRLKRDGLVDAHVLSPIRTLWERYLVGPESSSDPGQWRTQLNLPLGPIASHT